MPQRLTKPALLALGLSLTLWSSAFAGIRAGLHGYRPGQLAVLRFLIASSTLAVYAAVAHFRRPAWRDLPRLAFTGIVGITFYNVALNYGETKVTAGAASLLIASAPIWTALMAMPALSERLTPIGWGGVLSSFGGVALIASGEAGGLHFSPHAFLILAAAITSGLYIVLQKQFLSRYTALEFTAFSVWLGTLFMLPFGGGLSQAVRTAPIASTAAVVYLGIFPGAIAYVAYAYVLTHGSAGKTASFLYSQPVLAIAIAWIWLGEVPSLISLIGGAIALAGVVVVNVWGRASAPRTSAFTQGPECAD